MVKLRKTVTRPASSFCSGTSTGSRSRKIKSGLNTTTRTSSHLPTWIESFLFQPKSPRVSYRSPEFTKYLRELESAAHKKADTSLCSRISQQFSTCNTSRRNSQISFQSSSSSSSSIFESSNHYLYVDSHASGNQTATTEATAAAATKRASQRSVATPTRTPTTNTNNSTNNEDKRRKNSHNDNSRSVPLLPSLSTHCKGKCSCVNSNYSQRKHNKEPSSRRIEVSMSTGTERIGKQTEPSSQIMVGVTMPTPHVTDRECDAQAQPHSQIANPSSPITTKDNTSSIGPTTTITTFVFYFHANADSIAEGALSVAQRCVKEFSNKQLRSRDRRKCRSSASQCEESERRCQTGPQDGKVEKDVNNNGDQDEDDDGNQVENDMIDGKGAKVISAFCPSFKSQCVTNSRLIFVAPEYPGYCLATYGKIQPSADSVYASCKRIFCHTLAPLWQETVSNPNSHLRIILMGRSLGSHFAARLASDCAGGQIILSPERSDPKIKIVPQVIPLAKVILVCPFYSLRRLAPEFLQSNCYMPFQKVNSWVCNRMIPYDAFNTALYIRQHLSYLKSNKNKTNQELDYIFVHGKQDSMINSSHSQLLFAQIEKTLKRWSSSKNNIRTPNQYQWKINPHLFLHPKKSHNNVSEPISLLL